MKSEYLEKVAQKVIQEWVKSRDNIGAAKVKTDEPQSKVNSVQSVEEALIVHELIAKITNHFSSLGGIGGFKLGWKKYGQYEALFCPLIANSIVDDGESINIAKHNIHVAEAEFGFVLKNSFKDRLEEYTMLEVYNAVEAIYPCIELCGRRSDKIFNEKSAKDLNDISDLLLNSFTIVGTSFGKPKFDDCLNFSKTNVFFSSSPIGSCGRNSKMIVNGQGENSICGSPLASLTYLVNRLHVHGKNKVFQIQPGMLVITGHCCRIWLKKNDDSRPCDAPEMNLICNQELKATFQGFGHVSFKLT